ncbi:MAG: glycoside hydrolase family 3 N-terminal domain-containing protein [Pseudolabrys sp.]
MASRAFIAGLAGLKVSADERAFFREARPWGLIVFKRNVSNPAQLADLVLSFRDIVGWPAPVLVDQEGGRVRRLQPPHWPAYPPGTVYSALYDREPALGLSAARLGGHLIAADLKAVGIDVDCLPLADVPVQGADAVIGDRAYGHEPGKVAAIAAAVAAGLQAGGVLPVLKHLPGHGHVVFSALDPGVPATTSVTMVQQVIRGFIGFEGLLMSDDISMGALSGTLAERARAALVAGCDLVLHCNGDLAEMVQVAGAVPELSGEAAARAERALNARHAGEDFDVAAARKTFNDMVAAVTAPGERTTGS